MKAARIIRGEAHGDGLYSLSVNGYDLVRLEQAEGCDDPTFQQVLNVVHAALDGLDLDIIPETCEPPAVIREILANRRT